ncbi:MAG: hypothetical protein M3Z25_11280 [Actinomycetota bacterium]|nr:hypothetical protein [Actinomycetota bacterium]
MAGVTDRVPVPWQAISPDRGGAVVTAALPVRGNDTVRIEQPRLPGLDDIRGVAVLGYHLDLQWAGGGFLGVEIFFTLSGFLITYLLTAELRRRGRIEVAAFVRARARRLLPGLVACVLGTGGLLPVGCCPARHPVCAATPWPGCCTRRTGTSCWPGSPTARSSADHHRCCTCGRSPSRCSSTCAGCCCSSASSAGSGEASGSGSPWYSPRRPRWSWPGGQPGRGHVRLRRHRCTGASGFLLGAALALI